MKNARETALRVLMEYRQKGAWPNMLLKKELVGLGAEDAGLVTAIAYGVLQQMQLLDFYIGHYSTIKINKIMPQVLDILRMGAYQLLFMDRVPAFAVVDESVKLAKKHGGFRAGGFVNALLRKVDASRDELPQPDQKDWHQYLSIKYSHPRWFVDKMAGLLGDEETEALLMANNGPVRPTARVNTSKISRDALIDRLAGRGVDVREHDYLPDAISFESLRGVAGGQEMEEGLLYIMDTASQLCVHVLGPVPGAGVIDMCAAPGGKTMMAAQMMEGKGKILAMDVHPHKADVLERNAKTYGFEEITEIIAFDASRFIKKLEASADYVICDVPCSGFGIVRKKPDIRYNSPEGFGQLRELQRQILDNAGRYLAPGGVMVYSTCTIFPEENEEMVEAFLRDNPGFEAEGFTLPYFNEVSRGMLTLYPHMHNTDGFFMARIRRKS